jgi:hypothetical protein
VSILKSARRVFDKKNRTVFVAQKHLGHVLHLTADDLQHVVVVLDRAMVNKRPGAGSLRLLKFAHGVKDRTKKQRNYT